MSRFQKDPRSFALDLIDEGRATHKTLLIACLNAMSHDDVRDMLDANELSPRFLDEENENEDDQED